DMPTLPVVAVIKPLLVRLPEPVKRLTVCPLITARGAPATDWFVMFPPAFTLRTPGEKILPWLKTLPATFNARVLDGKSPLSPGLGVASPESNPCGPIASDPKFKTEVLLAVVCEAYTEPYTAVGPFTTKGLLGVKPTPLTVTMRGTNKPLNE